jgi:hypothetical protein
MGVANGWQYGSETPPAVMIMNLMPPAAAAHADGRFAQSLVTIPPGFQQVSSPADQ